MASSSCGRARLDLEIDRLWSLSGQVITYASALSACEAARDYRQALLLVRRLDGVEALASSIRPGPLDVRTHVARVTPRAG